MKKIYKCHILVGAGVLISVMAGCNNESEPNSGLSKGVPAVIEVTLSDAQTRATVDNTNGWTFTGFREGDQIGLFAFAGNMTTQPGTPEDQEGWIINEYMTYERANGTSLRFKNDDLLINPTLMSGTNMYGYFPYSPAMSNVMPGEDGTFSTEGLVLRQVDPDDNITKCIDYLEMTPRVNSGQLSGQLNHVFSQLVIVRGNGFDKPKAQDGINAQEIKVVLTQPFNKIRVNAVVSGSTKNWRHPLIYDADLEMTEEEAKTWQAWTYEDTKWEDKEANYVVLPTAANVTGVSTLSEIDYILIYDNSGHLQKISNFTINGTDKKLKTGTIYYLEVELVELEPTIRPYKINSWNEEEIVDENEVGIGSAQEFSAWINAYNTYLTDDRNLESRWEDLYQYGNVSITYTDELQNTIASVKWTFYITGDIEFTNQSSMSPLIPELKDELVGASTYSNVTLSDLKNTFVGVMSGEAAIKNIDFDAPFVRTNSNLVGIIANTIDKGTIDNINIYNGTLIGTGGVGMVAGSMQTGAVTNSSFSGSIFGSFTFESGLFGSSINTTDVTLTNNTTLEISSNTTN